MADDMIEPLLVGTVIVVPMVIFHVAGLLFLSQLLKRLAKRSPEQDHLALWWFLTVAVLAILGLHTVEAWCWGAVYLALGEFATMKDALYFSVVTSTTLGYGDMLLSERWRLLSTFEAMGGLILFAVSTAYLLALLRRFLDSDGAA